MFVHPVRNESAKRVIVETTKFAEEEARRMGENEAARTEEEELKRRAAEEETKRRAEDEDKTRAKEEAMQMEEETKRIAEEEAQRRAAAEETMRRRAEEAATKWAEEEAKNKTEGEAKHREEGEVTLRAEEEAKLYEDVSKRKAEVEAERTTEGEAKEVEGEETSQAAQNEGQGYIPYADVDDAEVSPFAINGAEVAELSAAVGELLGDMDIKDEEVRDSEGYGGEDSGVVKGSGSKFGLAFLRNKAPPPPMAPRPEESNGADPTAKSDQGKGCAEASEGKGEGDSVAASPVRVSRGYLWMKTRKLTTADSRDQALPDTDEGPPTTGGSGGRRFSLRAKLKAGHMEWQRYWFILRGGAIYYYSDSRLLHGLGVIDLLFCHVKTLLVEGAGGDEPIPTSTTEPTARTRATTQLPYRTKGGRQARFVLVLPEAEHNMSSDDGLDAAWVRAISDEIMRAGQSALEAEARRLHELRRNSVALGREAETKRPPISRALAGVRPESNTVAESAFPTPMSVSTMDVRALRTSMDKVGPSSAAISPRSIPELRAAAKEEVALSDPIPRSGGSPRGGMHETVPSAASAGPGRAGVAGSKIKDLRLSGMQALGEEELLEEFQALLAESDSALQDIASVMGVEAFTGPEHSAKEPPLEPPIDPISPRSPRNLSYALDTVVKEGVLRLRRHKAKWKKKRFDQVWGQLLGDGSLLLFASRQDSISGKPLEKVLLMLACVREIGALDAHAGVHARVEGAGAGATSPRPSGGGPEANRARTLTGASRARLRPKGEGGGLGARDVGGTFEVVTNQSKYVLRARTPEECATWVRVLNAVKKDQMRRKLRHTLTERRASFLQQLRTSLADEEYLTALVDGDSFVGSSNHAPLSRVHADTSLPAAATGEFGRSSDSVRKILRELLAIEGNNICADCGSLAPRWASVSLGVFLCIECGGVHRGLGSDVSKVKSLTLDNWQQDELDFMRSAGNRNVNTTWEAQLPPDTPRPQTAEDRYNFIHRKWMEKAFL